MNSVNWRGLPWRWYLLAIVALILDQVTKQWVAHSLSMYERVNVFPFFDLTLRHNPGAAFSFLASQGGWQVWFFSIISTVASVALVVWMARVDRKNVLEILGLALILSGALGNLYDRLTLGYVIDFILVYYKSYEYPAFNVADSAICLGAAVLIYDALFRQKKTQDTNQESNT